MPHVVRAPSGQIVAHSRGVVAAHRASRRIGQFGSVERCGSTRSQNRARAIRLDDEGLVDASRQIAEKIRAAVAKFPPGQPVGGSLVVDPRDRGYVRFRTVRGDEMRVQYHVYSVTPRRGDVFRPGKVIVGGHLDILMHRPSLVVVNVNGSMTPEEIASSKLEDGVLHLLAHEMTHAAEARYIREIEGGGRARRVSDEYAREHGGVDRFDLGEEAYRDVVYFNTPTEVRAFGQQVVREALATVSPSARVTDRIISKILDRSPTWDRIRVHLTEENLRRIMLMVWRALEERHVSDASANRAVAARHPVDPALVAAADEAGRIAYRTGRSNSPTSDPTMSALLAAAPGEPRDKVAYVDAFLRAWSDESGKDPTPIAPIWTPQRRAKIRIGSWNLANRAGGAFKVIDVKDTRQFEEIGDRWVPIPGSGDIRPCDRCEKPHEVHALVETEDGRTMIVGTGCMGLGPEAARKYASRATTIARLRAQLAGAIEKLEKRKTARAAARAMTPPAAEVQDDPKYGRVVRVGDVWMSMQFGRSVEEATKQAIMHWRNDRENEIAGGPGSVYSLADLVENLKKRLKKAEVGDNR